MCGEGICEDYDSLLGNMNIVPGDEYEE